MVIVWGSRLYGKVDVVPGLFHVATKFGHLWYIPLIPMGSCVVLSQDGSGWRGVPISLSLKSVLMAWARIGLFIMALIASMTVVMIAGDRRPQGLGGAIVFAVVMWTLFGLTWHKFITRASFNRATQLAQEIGITGQAMAAIQQIYGQSAGRGFDLQQAASMKAPTPAMSATPVQRAAAASGSSSRSAVAPQSSRRAPVADDAPIPLEPLSPAPARPAARAKPQAAPEASPQASPQRKGPRPPGQIGIA